MWALLWHNGALVYRKTPRGKPRTVEQTEQIQFKVGDSSSGLVKKVPRECLRSVTEYLCCASTVSGCIECNRL